MTRVRAILWDADGVLQRPPAGWNWRDDIDRIAGPGFSEIVYAAEIPSLRGDERFRDALARLLVEHPQSPLSADDLIGVWEMTAVEPGAFELVGEVRAHGVQCILATNQHDHRRAWMRDELGYDQHFDRVFYSCEMGVMKPDPEFFRRILDEAGLSAGEVGFIDDSAKNIVTATDLGIRAVLHGPSSGVAGLRMAVGEILRPSG